MFTTFIENHTLEKNIPPEIRFFIDIQKQKRSKKFPSFIIPFVPTKTHRALGPNIEKLNLTSNLNLEMYQYQTFPIFDKDLFIKPRQIRNYDEEQAPVSISKEKEIVIMK